MKVIVAIVISILCIVHSTIHWPEEAFISKFFSFLQLFLYFFLPSWACCTLTATTTFSLMSSAHIPFTICSSMGLSTTASHSACYWYGDRRKDDEPVLLPHAQGLSRTHWVVVLQTKQPPVPPSLGAPASWTSIFLIWHHHNLVLVVIMIASVLEGPPCHSLMVHILGFSSLFSQGLSDGTLNLIKRLRGEKSSIFTEITRVPLMIIVLIMIVVGWILIH